VDPVTPEILFERRWALTLRAVERVREEYAASKRLTCSELKEFLSASPAARSYRYSLRHQRGSRQRDHSTAQTLRRILREEISHLAARRKRSMTFGIDRGGGEVKGVKPLNR
jgi:hypothetical protein